MVFSRRTEEGDFEEEVRKLKGRFYLVALSFFASWLIFTVLCFLVFRSRRTTFCSLSSWGPMRMA